MVLVKFVPHGPIHIKPVLVQIMAWYQTGDSFWMFKHGDWKPADNFKAYFP